MAGRKKGEDENGGRSAIYTAIERFGPSEMTLMKDKQPLLAFYPEASPHRTYIIISIATGRCPGIVTFTKYRVFGNETGILFFASCVISYPAIAM